MSDGLIISLYVCDSMGGMGVTEVRGYCQATLTKYLSPISQSFLPKAEKEWADYSAGYAE